MLLTEGGRRGDMNENRKILKVFLASPNDLADERKAAREEVERLNKLISQKFKWHIDLLGWEDRLPGTGRPQAIINEDVKKCDLFIGLLWKRWGKPTGKTDSGFKEEFEIARDRFQKDQKPDIHIFLKEISQESLIDPGDQLKKVLEFKTWLTETNEYFYKRFRDLNDWKKYIFDDLFEYIYSLYADDSENKQLIQKTNHGNLALTENAILTTDLILQKLNGAKDYRMLSKLTALEKLRLSILANSLFSESFSSGGFLGNHECNLIYFHRNKLYLEDKEKIHLLRTMFESNSHLRPVWYWFRNEKEEDLTKILISLIHKNQDDFVLKNLAKIISNEHFDAEMDVFFRLIEFSSPEEQNSIATGVPIYFYSKEIKKTKEFFKSLAEINTKLLPLSEDLIWYHETMEDPNRSLSRLIDEEISDSIKLNILRRFSSNLAKEKLKSGLASNQKSIIKFCFEELVKREGLDKNDLIQLLESIDLDTKSLVLKYILKNNILPISNINSYIPKISSEFEELYKLSLSNKPFEELKLLLEVTDDHEHLIYETLAIKHFEKFSNILRSDLDDNFGWISNDYEESSNETSLYKSIFNLLSVSEQKRRSFIAAGLKGIKENGTSEDVKYAIKYFVQNHSKIIDEECLEIFYKYGSEKNTTFILNQFPKIDNELKVLAIKTVIHLSRWENQYIMNILTYPDNTVQTIALSLVDSELLKSVKHILIDKLTNAEHKIRQKAAILITQILSANDVEQLLSNYISNSGYYYDVVTIFDRILFTKGKLKRVYQAIHKQLREEIDEFRLFL